ncbi:MAG: hypothetical protein QOG14_4403 [Mycobacterium sp.]|jgi:hypothetical protein|nr:hypothetical protein [Mycobacterium sp.]
MSLSADYPCSVPPSQYEVDGGTQDIGEKAYNQRFPATTTTKMRMN